MRKRIRYTRAQRKHSDQMDIKQYLKARVFLGELADLRSQITPDQYRTLKQLALHGDIEGARKWLIHSK